MRKVKKGEDNQGWGSNTTKENNELINKPMHMGNNTRAD